ncbi:MAG: hypothetical protein GY809_01560, partial [Planctomycetes bacterium]|nr:hypothetical protein [Planctomycetota bacterium]
VKQCERLESDLNAVANYGSFSYKKAVMTGDDVDPVKVLGVVWSPREDTLKVNCTINVHKKIKGAKSAPDLDFDNLILPEVLTRRIIWRAVMGPYDPYGLISAIIIQLKLVMKKLSTLDGSVNGWDAQVNEDAAVSFIKACKNLAGASLIPFPRCVAIQDAVGQPQLVVFVDGSLLAICTAAYIRWQLPGTGWKCFLLAAKCKVAPKLEVTVPRMELMAAQIGRRLADKIIESMTDFQFKESVFLTDSSAVFGMLAAPSGSLSIFAGHRVSEIKTESGPTRWLWVPTQENISDLGTRCSATPADLGPGSAWQDGPSWLQLPESSWPTKANMHGEVPAGEIKPPRIALAVSAEPESRPIESEEPPAAAPQLKPTKGWFPIEK